MRFVFVPAILICLSLSAFAQCPKTKLRKKLTSVWNINADLSSDLTCRIARYSGRITGLQYSNDTSVDPNAFILELASGRRLWIGVPENIEKCFSQVESADWEAQLVKNSRVMVSVWQCGAAGRGDLELNRIDFR